MKHDYETLLVAPRDDRLLLATLNRPDALNALNTQMALDLVDPKPGSASCVGGGGPSMDLGSPRRPFDSGLTKRSSDLTPD